MYPGVGKSSSDDGMVPIESEDLGPYRREYRAFSRFIRGERMLFSDAVILGLKSFLSLFEMAIRYIPGPIGFKLRYHYYKFFMKRLGKNVLIDVDVMFSGPKNISIGEYTWIDSHCILNAFLGEIRIGRRVHVAPFTIIGARAPVVVEDYAGLSSGVRIYANSEHPIDGKRMSGPMVPEDMKAFRSAPVVLRKDSFVGANSVILPGVEVGEGAVIGANSVISKSVNPYEIVVGSGRVVGRRDPVVMPDI